MNINSLRPLGGDNRRDWENEFKIALALSNNLFISVPLPQDPFCNLTLMLAWQQNERFETTWNIRTSNLVRDWENARWYFAWLTLDNLKKYMPLFHASYISDVDVCTGSIISLRHIVTAASCLEYTEKYDSFHISCKPIWSNFPIKVECLGTLGGRSSSVPKPSHGGNGGSLSSPWRGLKTRNGRKDTMSPECVKKVHKNQNYKQIKIMHLQGMKWGKGGGGGGRGGGCSMPQINKV